MKFFKGSSWRVTVPWLLLQLYVMMATSSYWVFLRIGFMPFYSEEVEQGADRQGVLLNGFKHALTSPNLCFDVNNVYLWHGTAWNETPIFEWYELLVKWSLLAVLALQARLSAFLLNKTLARMES